MNLDRLSKISALLLLTACSPMTTPALRHETGEVLPVKRVRIQGVAEKAVLHPAPATGSAYEGVPQQTSVFQGTHMGLGAAVGITPTIEGQFSSYFMGRGAGWRLGVKTPLRKFGRFSLAATFKIGTYSGDGSISLLDAFGASHDVDFSLSAKQVDIGFPISARFGAVTVYSGLALIKSWVRGTADGAPVSDIATDYVFNLGARFPIYGTLDLDTEIALVKLGDRFTQDSQMLPYYGLGVGSVF